MNHTVIQWCGHQLCRTTKTEKHHRVIEGFEAVVHEQRRAMGAVRKNEFELRTEYGACASREVHGFSHIDSDDIGRTLGVISMRALGIRSSYKGRTVDA